MEPTFDVYLSGDLLEGFTPESVAGNLARLFKVDAAAAAKLVDGQQHRVKSNCNKAAALQYRKALTEIGANVTVLRHGADAPTSAETSAESANAPSPRAAATPAAGKADFLSDMPADRNPHPGSSALPATPEQARHIAQAKARESGKSASFESYRPGDKPIDFQPSGHGSSDPRLIDELTIAPVGALISEGGSEPAYKLVTPPDFDVAPPGEPIPTLQEHKEAINPNIDHLHLAPLRDDVKEN